MYVGMPLHQYSEHVTWIISFEIFFKGTLSNDYNKIKLATNVSK